MSIIFAILGGRLLQVLGGVSSINDGIDASDALRLAIKQPQAVTTILDMLTDVDTADVRQPLMGTILLHSMMRKASRS